MSLIVAVVCAGESEHDVVDGYGFVWLVMTVAYVMCALACMPGGMRNLPVLCVGPPDDELSFRLRLLKLRNCELDKVGVK